MEPGGNRIEVMGDPGDSAFVPAGVVHASYGAGDGPSRLLAIFGPGVGGAGLVSVDKSQKRPGAGRA